MAVWHPTRDDTVAFWPRALARFLDAVFVAGVGTAATFLGSVIREVGLPLPVLTMTIWQSIGISVVISTATDAMAQAVGGATLGKYVLGLRVRMTDGAMCTPGAALKREILYFWDALFFAIIAYSAIKASPLRQRSGDRWARTIVVRNAAMPEGSRGGQRAIIGALSLLSIYFTYNLFLEG